MYSFAMTSDGYLYSGADALPILQDLEQSGAAAVGFNCVAADMLTPQLVARLAKSLSLPLLCKPNAGMPVIKEDGIAHYEMSPQDFAAVVRDCQAMGATLVGGCCGTTPAHIAALCR